MKIKTQYEMNGFKRFELQYTLLYEVYENTKQFKKAGKN